LAPTRAIGELLAKGWGKNLREVIVPERVQYLADMEKLDLLTSSAAEIGAAGPSKIVHEKVLTGQDRATKKGTAI